MPQKSALSKGLAAAFVVMTVSAIGGMISMIVVYEVQRVNVTMTPRPPMPNTTQAPAPDMRLPRSLIPEYYEIVIQPHFYHRIVEEVNVTTPNQTLLFEGKSTVHFQCHKGTDRIFLHSHGLQVFNPIVIDKDEDQVISNIFLNPQNESDFLEIELIESDLKPGGNYSLFLNFTGQISEYLQALYVSTYTEQNFDAVNDTIEERFLLATNLQPTSARRLFPCFDEPDMKAVFQLKIIHRRDTDAFSNTRTQSKVIIDDDWQYTHFFPTPKMSSYLLAFTVSELKPKLSATNRVTIRTFARPEATAAGHTDYAARITANILDFYEKHFALEYGMTELRQFALPDLEPLAMENWGLITYQEGVLLFEEGVSSWLHKELITTVIAHELAHQWFGNQVTMKWWNEIWLNEGFATYMSYLAVDYAEPSFKIKEKLIMDDLHTAFEEDALLTSHPLSTPSGNVQTTDEILGMFDAISYSKGAMVLRMLVNIIGESVFDTAIKAYLKQHSGGNVDQGDLWKFMEDAQIVRNVYTVPAFMETWTTKIGYPVININTTNGEIFQEHFLYNSSAVTGQSWIVQVTFMKNMSNPDFIWLASSIKERNEDFISKKGEWLLANINCTGYYRVNYNQENWQRLLNQLDTNPYLIPRMNRGQLIDDAFNLARGKRLDVRLALNSTRFLRKERDYLPWESAVRNLEYFILMFDRSEVFGPMQLYLRHQVEELYSFFKNDTDASIVPEDHSSQHNQITAIEVACSNGLPDCVEMSKEMFADWMDKNENDTNSIHTNLRSVIYCQALAAGGKKEWEFAWERFQFSDNTSEENQLRKALSCTKKTWLLHRYLEYTLDPSKIRLMDVTSTINLIAQNAAGQALAWNFVRAHWDYVSQGDAASLIMGVTRRFSTEFELQELIRFMQETDLQGAQSAMFQAIEQTQINIQWVKENRKIVLEWFEAETEHLE